MSLPLHELAQTDPSSSIVRVTENGLEFFPAPVVVKTLIPTRPLEEGEQYRFHFNMTKCIGCRSCEVACNEQNNTPADLRWRRIGEVEGGTWPDTARHYLSMGCNHCLDAECVKGCPVDAYTKDPLTGIVLHSADACIGCQYCVWNCPYSVPQFNPERGVVGKCDMCHGRLTDGLEPACVNACPEDAIEIEIVSKLAWRLDFATAEAPGMPAAVHSLSTTRITVPPNAAVALDRVDLETLRTEHPHWSLIWMTTFIQLAAGALTAALLSRHTGPIALTLLLALTAVTLNISVFHLGRPAYAWRALKAWRRSWLSREVLLFGLFFSSLAALTLLAWVIALHPFPQAHALFVTVAVLTPTFGIAGILASAYIYLVPARPSWDTLHTPIDFLLSAALLGTTALPLLLHLTANLRVVLLLTTAHLPLLHTLVLPAFSEHFPVLPAALSTVLWIINHIARLLRLHHSPLYEQRATASLLNSTDLRGTFLVSFAFVLLALGLTLAGSTTLAPLAAMAAVIAARYLFFVSVVPLNMALTFVRSVHA